MIKALALAGITAALTTPAFIPPAHQDSIRQDFSWHHGDGTTTYHSFGIGSGCTDGTVPIPTGKIFQCVDPQDPDIDPDIPDAIVDAGRHGGGGHGHGHRRR
jgi:hypothetical protein